MLQVSLSLSLWEYLSVLWILHVFYAFTLNYLVCRHKIFLSSCLLSRVITQFFRLCLGGFFIYYFLLLARVQLQNSEAFVLPLVVLKRFQHLVLFLETIIFLVFFRFLFYRDPWWDYVIHQILFLEVNNKIILCFILLSSTDLSRDLHWLIGHIYQ